MKTSWNNELKLDSWKEKKLHGQFYEEYPEQHMKENLEVVKKSRLEDQNKKALICAGQEQAQRTNHVTDTPLTARPCKSLLCRECVESVKHIVCECKKFAQREYKQKHDNIAKVVG